MILSPLDLRIGSIMVAMLLAATLTVKADIQIDRPDDDAIVIGIMGTITARDSKSVQDISNEMARKRLQVYFDSEGGDVSAAITIGRLVRNYDGWTLIGDGAKCYGSCALIFISGVVRLIAGSGELGIHRPYPASAPPNREAIEKQVSLTLSTVKDYVAEMGITDSFYQQMVNTQPPKIVVYELDNYEKLVPRTDPTSADVATAREARNYGITASEMRQRNQEARRCSNLPAQKWLDCESAIKWGLSEGAYRERWANVVKECRFSDKSPWNDEDNVTFKSTPLKLRSELPFVLHWEACKRNIMVGR